MATELVTLEEGKYTLVHDTNGGLSALRHGEPWQDLTGNKMVYACFCEIAELRKRLSEIHDLTASTALTAEGAMEDVASLAKPTWPEGDYRG